MPVLWPDQCEGEKKEVTGREREGESGIVGRVADTAQATRFIYRDLAAQPLDTGSQSGQRERGGLRQSQRRKGGVTLRKFSMCSFQHLKAQCDISFSWCSADRCVKQSS